MRWNRAQRMLCVVGASVFWTIGAGDQLFRQATAELATPEMTIHVTMKDRQFHITGHTTPGALTAIVLHNEDKVTHGFSSPLFRQTLVITEGDAEEIRRKGHIFSYHVDPGHSARIYFKKSARSETETSQIPFWCDIHAQMQGEFLVVETTGGM